jgi:ATP-dependent RNA helicase DDX23/PRP28
VIAGEATQLVVSKADEQAELEAIKERYLGGEAKKRHIRRMNEKKFVFDWENTEDTSTDYNPLCV